MKAAVEEADPSLQPSIPEPQLLPPLGPPLSAERERRLGDWFTFSVQWVWYMDTFKLTQMKSTVAEWSLKAQFAFPDPP